GTPIGPLWVDAAWPIANRGTNSGVRFSFGIGRTF
ncbi:MAG: BamA/TamA family outer membrane protein, partial [Thermoanaerobaculales bacterium]|nr:BamA/TamA family outer membrane protein [Thermoanaerobaculales bacterium]